MYKAKPIEVMLGQLARADKPSSYLSLWMHFVRSVGGWVCLTISGDGEEELGFGLPCDSQLRHRSRWMHYLWEDLRQNPEAHELLVITKMQKWEYTDNRPADPRETTQALRRLLDAGGVLLVDPEGALTLRNSIPRDIAFDDNRMNELLQASRNYLSVSRRWRSHCHIKRAVRMLGHRTSNGWMVLGEAAPQQSERNAEL